MKITAIWLSEMNLEGADGAREGVGVYLRCYEIDKLVSRGFQYYKINWKGHTKLFKA